MKKTRVLEIIREEITSALTELGQSPEEAKATNLAIAAEKAKIAAAQKNMQQLQKTGVSEISLEEDSLNEMAKIKGQLEAAIKKVIADNPDMEGLQLKKAIKSDKNVDDALEGDTMYDNQLNKFIALVKGEREAGQRGRKADPNKPSAEKTPKASTPKPSKPSTKGMDDEDKEAARAASSDSTARELGKMAPKDKIEKFNLGLKFINKYKDDKPKIDAYLKKAKEEYKLPSNMLKDLKKAAGREVGI